MRAVAACIVLLLSSAAAAEEPVEYDPEAVQSTIKDKYMKKIFDCYHDGLRRDSDLKGRITLTLTLKKDGKVKEATASGFDAKVDECIAKDAKGWRFPSSTVESTVPVTFSLQPAASVAAPKEVVAKVDAIIQKQYLDGMARCLPKAKKPRKKSKTPPKPPPSKPVTLTFLLRMDGSVRDFSAKGLKKKENVCVEKLGKSWAFPEAGGDSFYDVSMTVDVTPIVP